MRFVNVDPGGPAGEGMETFGGSPRLAFRAVFALVAIALFLGILWASPWRGRIATLLFSVFLVLAAAYVVLADRLLPCDVRLGPGNVIELRGGRVTCVEDVRRVIYHRGNDPERWDWGDYWTFEYDGGSWRLGAKHGERVAMRLRSLNPSIELRNDV